MDWVFAPTWMQSATRLDAGDAKRVLAFHNKLMEDPDATRPGLGFEHLEGVHDRHVQSLRVDRDLRAIAWHDGDVAVLLYVDHHDAAYRWAESARIDVTRGADGVSVAVTTGTAGGLLGMQGSTTGRPVTGRTPGLLDHVTTPELREAGVPDVLLPVVRGVCDETVLSDELCPSLRKDLGDNLLALYVEGPDAVAVPASSGAGNDGDASSDLAEPQPALPLAEIDPDGFQLLLENPTRWWLAFADPLQRKLAEGKFSGAVLVSGGAGTGKTVVALHRARHLARKGKKVLLTSFSLALCGMLEHDLSLLCDDETRRNIRVANIDRIAREICPDDQIELAVPGEDGYARRIRLAIEALSRKSAKSPYDAVVVDEIQDMDAGRLVLLHLLAGQGRDSLMLLGDGSQRIYGEPLDLEDLGISVEGRRFELGATYRTTVEIIEFGRRILADADDSEAALLDHADEGVGVHGPRPAMAGLASMREEALMVTMSIMEHVRRGVPLDRIAVFARRRKRLRGVECALNALGIPCMDLKAGSHAPLVGVRLMTMDMAKGLEFRVVYVVGASADELPNSVALSEATDDGAKKAVLRRERSRLYVSATRATHSLLVTWTSEPTAFLEGCGDVVELVPGFDVESCLHLELDTEQLQRDPAGFRIGGCDLVLGGRQITRTLDAYLKKHEREWLT